MTPNVVESGNKLSRFIRNLQEQLDCELKKPVEIERKYQLPEPENAQKRIVCFVGLPGTGKSQQIRNLQGVATAQRFHVGMLAGRGGTVVSEGKT